MAQVKDLRLLVENQSTNVKQTTKKLIESNEVIFDKKKRPH